MQLSIRYLNIKIDKYIVMPNHVHLLLVIKNNGLERQDLDRKNVDQQEARQEQSPCPTVGDIICALKSITTKKVNQNNVVKRKIWQFRYHDHIIRNEDEYLHISQYITENPKRWVEDRYYQN